MRGVKFTGPKVTMQRPARRRKTQSRQVVVVQPPRRRFGRGPQPVQVHVPDDDQQPAGWDWRGSTAWRNRRQLGPLVIPAALVTVAAVLQMAVALGADRHRLALGVFAVAVLTALAAAKAGAGRLDPRWRSRVWAWAIVGPTWLLATVAADTRQLLLELFAALILFTNAVTSRWWAEHRPSHPTHRPVADTPSDAPPAVDDIVGNFTRYAACKGGPAEECTLTEASINDARSAYTMRIRPGKDSLDKMLQRMDVLATAVHHQPGDLMLEQQQPPPGQRANPNLLRFTVITRSPVAQTVAYTGPQWYEDGYDAWIEAGTWADGDGRVRIPVLSANSAWNLAILAPMGGGKSALLNSLAISARASGRAVIWYADGKGGASSPTLREYADWAPGGIEEEEIKDAGRQVLTALERLAAQRMRQMKIDGVAGLNPTPEVPLVIVILDECHVFLDPADKATVARWNRIVRLLRFAGVAIWVATQFPNIMSFGGDSFLKEAFMGRTTVVGRFTTGVAKGLLNVDFNPKLLPDDGGYFFLDSRHGRSAIWRGDYVDDNRTPGARDSQADRWLQNTKGGRLEDRTLRGMPEFYTRRAELAAEERERLLRDDGGYAPAEPVRRTPTPASGGAWRPQWPVLRPVPSTSTATPPAGLTGRQQDVWTEVAAGRGSATEVGDALGLAKTRVYDVLKELVDAGHVRAVDGARGRYEVTS